MPSTIVNQGSCLCQAVKVKVDEMNTDISACHCDMCRKWGGNSLLAADCGTKVTFEGEENITIFSSSEWAERGFCKICGTHLFYRLKGEKNFAIPIGIFDIDQHVSLAQQLFIDEKPTYYSFAEKTPTITGPELFAQFVGVG